jgi:hypothetical protein
MDTALRDMAAEARMTAVRGPGPCGPAGLNIIDSGKTR